MPIREALSSVVISPDPALVGLVREELGLDLELSSRFDALTKRQLDELKILKPQVIFLDLCDAPSAGCDFAQTLLEIHPPVHIVAVSADAQPDVLMTAIRAGVSEFLTKPVAREALAAAIGVLRRKLGLRGTGHPESRVIAFFRAKGGAGATTVAANFAIQLRHTTDRRIVLVDLDLELGEIALYLGMEPRFSVVDLVQNLHRLDDGLLATFMQHHESGIDVLAAPWDPRAAERVTPEHLRRLLAFLRDRYDYILVDTPSSVSPRSTAVLQSADEVFVVAQVDVPSVRNIQRCREVFEELGGGGRKIRLIVNRFEPRGEITLKDVTEALGMEVYWVFSNDYESVVYSINTGRPFAVNVPCAPTTEIAGLVARYTGMAEPRAGRQRLFSHLGSRFALKRKRRRSSPRPVRPPLAPLVVPSLEAPPAATGKR